MARIPIGNVTTRRESADDYSLIAEIECVAPRPGVIYHTWTLLKGIAMSTLLGVGTQVTFGNGQSNLVQAIQQSTQESANQAGQRIVEKDLNIQPTITVRPGWPLRVIVLREGLYRFTVSDRPMLASFDHNAVLRSGYHRCWLRWLPDDQRSQHYRHR
jgi:hypothetical protein